MGMNMKPTHWYTADFETTGQVNYEKDGEVRVWLWSLVRDDMRHWTGVTIEQFFKCLKRVEAKKVFFHNLAFDGMFILYAYRDREYGKDYEVLIDDKNNWYNITLHFGYGDCIIWDSLKKFPATSVAQLAHLYGIPDKHSKPDFSRYFPLYYVPTDTEIQYCIHDSEIVMHALNSERSKGHTSMTLSSDAFNEVKTILGAQNWRTQFPVLDCDVFLRNAYRGGWTYLKPEYSGVELDDIHVYDVNSLYPHVMYNCELPYGEPWSSTEPESDCHITKMNVELELKDGMLPTIMIKDDKRYSPTTYLTCTDGPTDITLTSTDWNLLKEHYDVTINEVYWTMNFHKKQGLMKEYIDYYMQEKIEATEKGDKARRKLAKLFLNSPYGKTGMNPMHINKIPYMENGKLKFKEEMSEGDPIYIPYACFVTAEARNITIRSAQHNYDGFVYADTDSIHLLGEADGIKVHDTELGAWKLEGVFPKGKYLRAKAYAHADADYNITDVKCAGMTEEAKAQVTWDNFKFGTTFTGKLSKRNVKGGCMLVPTTYCIDYKEGIGYGWF